MLETACRLDERVRVLVMFFDTGRHGQHAWIEDDLLDAVAEEGVGVVAFSPLAQGMLTDKYLNGLAPQSRASLNVSLKTDFLTEENIARVQALNGIAASREQSLAQMAIAWVLRDSRVTTALIGASRWSQIEDSLGALDNLEFTASELADIDRHAVDGGVNIWAASSSED